MICPNCKARLHQCLILPLLQITVLNIGDIYFIVDPFLYLACLISLTTITDDMARNFYRITPPIIRRLTLFSAMDPPDMVVDFLKKSVAIGRSGKRSGQFCPKMLTDKLEHSQKSYEDHVISHKGMVGL